MSRSGKNTTFEVRQLVIMHEARGKSIRQISSILNVPKSNVCDIIKRFQREIESKVQFIKVEGKS